MARQFVEIGSGTAITADTTHDFNVPSGAIAAVFYLDATDFEGTTPTMDVKLQYTDPTGTDEVIDMDNGAFAQLTADDTQAVLQVGPGLANDNTGSVRSTNALLGGRMRAVIDIDRSTGDETYSYTLSADFVG